MKRAWRRTPNGARRELGEKVLRSFGVLLLNVSRGIDAEEAEERRLAKDLIAPFA